MRIAHLASVIILLATIVSCNNNSHQRESAVSKQATEDYIGSADSVSFSGDIASLNSFSRKIIHNISFHCRVDDVFTATTQLEKLVKSTGGIVAESKIKHEISMVKEMKYSKDSIKKIQSYKTTADIILKVPVNALDTVLEYIPQLANFIEDRTFTRSDVTLSYLSNSLKNNAVNKATGKKALQQASKTNETIDAADYADNKEHEIINRKIANLEMLDQVNYATIQVAFSQPEKIDEQIVLDIYNYAAPSYGEKFIQAINLGINITGEILLFFIRLWPLILIVSAIIIFWKKKQYKIALRTK